MSWGMPAFHQSAESGATGKPSSASAMAGARIADMLSLPEPKRSTYAGAL